MFAYLRSYLSFVHSFPYTQSIQKEKNEHHQWLKHKAISQTICEVNASKNRKTFPIHTISLCAFRIRFYVFCTPRLVQRKTRKGHSHVRIMYTAPVKCSCSSFCRCLYTKFFASRTLKLPPNSGLIKLVRFTSVFGHLFRFDSFTRQLFPSFVCAANYYISPHISTEIATLLVLIKCVRR